MKFKFSLIERLHIWRGIHLTENQFILILSFVVGLCSGLAAVILKNTIHLTYQLVLKAINSGYGNYIYLALPAIGILLTTLWLKYHVKDNISHGITRVLFCISRKNGIIKGHNTYTGIVGSSLTIGFGGSVGAEAPIVLTGAAIGSNLARLFKLNYKQVILMIGCGAAGAVAGIFKAPLAGILFTLEILLFNISMTSILPMLLSAVSATVVSYLFLGVTPQFTCDLTPFAMRNIPAYIVLGIFCALCSLYFNNMTLWLEDKLKKVRNRYVKWVMCALSLTLLIFLFPTLFGEGYDSLQCFLDGRVPDLSGKTPLAFFMNSPVLIPIFFLIVILVKVFSMTFTNAGGGVGGTFGPTLFVGGMAGFVVARFINLIFISSPFSVPEANFVLVGMAGLMAGVMQAPMTAIFLIAEISGGYNLLIPLIITATISYGISHTIDPYSIYTKRIAKRGELLTHDSDQAVLTLLKMEDFIESDFQPVLIDDTLGTFVKAVADSKRNIFPVLDSRNRFQGFVRLEDIRKDMFKTELYDALHVYNFMQSAPAYIEDNDSMQDVMNKFETTDAWNLPVVGEGRIYKGFVSKSKIFSAYRTQLREVSHD